MLVQAKKIVKLGLIALAIVVISLPAISYSATSPVVSVLSPLKNGLRAPVKIALDADGNIYVADQRVSGVVKFTASGTQQLTIRTVAAPNGLAFAQDGTLLVSQDSFVARYDVKTGAEIGRLIGGHLQSPVGIAVDDVTGFIYVADGRANQIEMYTASGAFVKAFGQGMSADASGATVSNPLGKLSMPTGIVFEKVSRNLIVADTLSSRVQFFDVDGNVVNKFLGVDGKLVNSIGNVIPKGTTSVSTATVGAMQFFMPTAIALEYTKDQSALSRIYVVDSYRSNLQVVDAATGSALNVAAAANNYIGYGSTNAALNTLLAPNDAVFDAANGRLLVVNGSGYVTIYGIDGGKNPVYVEPPVVVPPPPPVEIPAPALTITTTPFVTKSTIVSIAGTVEAGATVNIANKTGEVVIVGTTWSCDVALVEGVNTLTVTATKLGKTSTGTVAVTLDTVAPALNVSALANGANACDPVQNISGYVTDLGIVSVKVNDVDAVLSGNTFSVPVTLANGSNLISVVAKDVVGNTATYNSTVNYSAGSTDLTIAAPVDNSIVSNSILEFSGSAERTSLVSAAGVPAAMVANSWSFSADLLAGLNTVEVTAKDIYGNSCSVKRSIIFSTAKPALAVVTPSQDIAVKMPNITIKGTASGVTATTLEYTANGSTVAVPISAGEYSFNVDFTAEGNYPVLLTAKDAAGNTSTVVRTVVYDITPPTFSLDQVVGVMPDKLSGSVEAGSSVVVKALVGSDVPETIGTVVITDGTWKADLAGVAYVPETLLAVAIDAAGNSTSKTLTYSFPSGTLNADGKPTVQDALRAIRIVVNKLTPSAAELASYDVGPLVSGMPNPNGKIEIVDAILILRKALGLKSW